MDSYRIGVVDDKQSILEFKNLRTCCGSEEKVCEIEGVKFMFGCNFGH